MQIFKSIQSLFHKGMGIANGAARLGNRMMSPITEMDGLELNKIAAAVLVAGLIAMVAGKASSIVYGGGEEGHGEEQKRGYTIAGAASDDAGGAPAAEEAPIAIATLLPKADKAKGEQIAKACAACHDFSKGGPNKVGPNLWGIVGNKHGHKDDFAYSKAIAEKPGNWDYQALSEFITKPSKYAPGTKMGFAGLKDPQQRADVLAYLQTVSDSPVPFPPAPAAGDPVVAKDGKPDDKAPVGKTPPGEKPANHPEQAKGATETRSGGQAGAQPAKLPADAAKDTAAKGKPAPQSVGLESTKDSVEKNVNPRTEKLIGGPKEPSKGAPPASAGEGTVKDDAAASKPVTPGTPPTTGEGGKHSTNPATPTSDAGGNGGQGNAAIGHSESGKSQLPASSAAPDAGTQGNVTSPKQD